MENKLNSAIINTNILSLNSIDKQVSEFHTTTTRHNLNVLVLIFRFNFKIIDILKTL